MNSAGGFIWSWSVTGGKPLRSTGSRSSAQSANVRYLLSMNTIMKTITATFEVPEPGKLTHISLSDTHGITVGSWMMIGLDSYRITKVSPLRVSVIKSKTIVPVGTSALLIEDNDDHQSEGITA